MKCSRCSKKTQRKYYQNIGSNAHSQPSEFLYDFWLKIEASQLSCEKCYRRSVLFQQVDGFKNFKFFRKLETQKLNCN